MNMKTLTETSTFRVLSLLLCFCFFIPAMNVSASSLQADKFKVSGIYCKRCHRRTGHRCQCG